MYRDNFSEEDREEDMGALVATYETMVGEMNVRFFEKKEFIQLIDYYENEQLTEKALEVIEYAMEQHPYSAQFLVRKAHILIDAQQETQALQLLEQAEHFDASDIDIFLLKADILARHNRFDEAFAILEYAEIRISQSDMEELHLAYANIYEHQEDFDKMFESLKAALLAAPENEDALERIWLCTELAHKYQESIDLHNHILDKNAYSHWAWFNLGHAHVGLNNFKTAAEAYEFAFTIEEDFELAYNYCAESFVEMEDFDEAIRVYKSALTVFPKHLEFCMQLGACYEAINQYRQAKNYYIKAARIDKTNAKVYFRLGECYSEEERWVHALSAYESAMNLAKDNPEYIAGVAEAHYQLDNNERADELFREALEIDTMNLDTWVQYISFLIALEKYDDAYEAVEVAEGYCNELELKCCKITVMYLHQHRKEALQLLQFLLLENKNTFETLVDLFPELKDEQAVLRVVAANQ
jgi:tetratricopeptide (TPR) repeat protein